MILYNAIYVMPSLRMKWIALEVTNTMSCISSISVVRKVQSRNMEDTIIVLSVCSMVVAIFLLA